MVGDIEQFDEVADDLAGRKVRVRPHAPEFDLQELHQVALAQARLIPKVAGVDLLQLFDENDQLLIGERVQMDDGRQHIAHALRSEAALREPRAQRLVAKDAAPAVLDALWRSSHNDAQVMRFALQGVVIHREDLLVVILAGDRVGNLVEVYQLVDEHEHALVTSAF